jgi:hypothetical protein
MITELAQVAQLALPYGKRNPPTGAAGSRPPDRVAAPTIDQRTP